LFSEHFAFRPHALVNFVGGGGKTTLLHRLMQEYASQGPVLCTTTTRIHPPEPTEGLSVISGEQLTLLQRIVEQIGRACPNSPYKLLVTRHFMSPNLLRGVPPDFDNGLDRTLYPILFNEGDGAAGYSLKLPREGEPVLMENADYLVPVLGIDCLQRRLGPDAVFRWQALAEKFALRSGDPITPERAAGILMHPQGVCKDWKSGMHIVPFINKVDGPGQDSAARELALAILSNSHFPVERVVWGSAIQRRACSVAAS